MNQIVARISKIESVDNLNIVTFDFHGRALKMMSLDLGEDVKVGKEVLLRIKPTHLIVAKNVSGMLSISNSISAKVTSIEHGKLLSSVKVTVNDMMLESIMIVESIEQMELKVEDDVSIMIAESELSIAKVL